MSIDNILRVYLLILNKIIFLLKVNLIKKEIKQVLHDDFHFEPITL